MYRKYKIFVGSRYNDMISMVNVLFAKGYLLGQRQRIGKISKEQYYEYPYRHYLQGQWIIFGADEICKRTFEVVDKCFLNDYYCEFDYTTILFEDFLKLNYQEEKA